MHHPLANFLQSTFAKNYEKLLRVDKVITTNTVCSFLAHPVDVKNKKCQSVYRVQILIDYFLSDNMKSFTSTVTCTNLCSIRRCFSLYYFTLQQKVIKRSVALQIFRSTSCCVHRLQCTVGPPVYRIVHHVAAFTLFCFFYSLISFGCTVTNREFR